ncbi:hypothetical protein NMY22_g19789 [Coprinellus aureogranulatus]|nr:hypothetical protein NMY22_g19789 [Coprinellus aureogranulatus]
MDDHHDLIAPGWVYNRAHAMTILLQSLRVHARTAPNNEGTEWSLGWTKATSTWKGEEAWVNVLRSIPFVTPFGTFNATQAPIVWCGLCHNMDHTTKYCPPPPHFPAG